MAQDRLGSSAKTECQLPQKDLGKSSGYIRSLGE